MKKSFIPLTALALFALVSCGNDQPTDSAISSNVEPTTSEATSATTSESASDSVSNEETINSVAITNKDALTAEWTVGDADRTLNIAVDPAGNVNSLINKGKITVVSSDSTVVSVSGKVLKALKAGTATITVTYGDKTDSVTVEVKRALTAIDEYGTVHEGTLADPLDNEDALVVATKTGETETQKYYYVKGTVYGFHTPAGNSKGNVSYYLTPAEGKTSKFLIYQAKGKDSAEVKEGDIWVGAEAVAKVKIVNYKSKTPETSSGGELVSVTGTKTVVQTKTATVAEAVTAALAISENNLASVDKYIVTGYVTGIYAAWDDGYKNMSVYMSDTMDDPNATFIAYQAGMATGTDNAKIVVGAKIKVTCYLAKYNTTPETTGSSSATIELVEETPGADVVATADEKSISVGATSQISVVAQEGVTFTYASSDETVATVSDGGLVTGVKAGKATITVTASTGRKAYIDFAIVEGEVVDTSITVAKAMEIADALENNAKTTDSYDIVGYVAKVTAAFSTQYKNISFTMSDNLDDPNASFVGFRVTTDSDTAKKIISGAKVKVTAKLTKYGSTLETVSGGTVEVLSEALTAVVASAASTIINVEGTSQISVVAQEGVTFTYASSDETVAAVSDGGLVTGVKAGEATITVTASTGRKAYININVYDKSNTIATWTPSSGDGITDTASSTVSSFMATFGSTSVNMSGTYIYLYNSALGMKSKSGDSFVYSTSAMPGTIKAISIKTSSTASNNANYAVTFGTSALSTKTSDSGKNVGTGSEYIWTSNADGATYFQIASTSSSYNGQLASVTVVYAASTVAA